jgi:phage minor structural protein
MFPILYDSVVTGTVPDHYGIGVLKDALSCEITEERNGEYELTLKYPSSGAYASYLVTRAIIKAKPNFTDDPQLFRIYKVGKEIGSSFSVYARHISYDLSGFPITAGSASNVGDALTLLNNQASGYTFTTDKSVHANFKVDKPSSVRSWFGGKAGSILDLYGPGDWKYNNFTCQFLANRGQDRGVTIRYGKNLTKLENIDDSSSLVTSIMAFWQSTDENPVTVISDAISTGATLDVTACQVIDASESYENQPTVAQLNTYVNNYISSHITNRVQKNIKLDFAQISKLLKDRVDLCDTVHIIYEDYGISATAKCIKTTWDVLQDKYTEIELGEARTNIADTIVGINKDLSDQLTANQVKSAIRDATDLITGNKGGYVVLHDSDEDGYPDELLIMNTADISTATKVWRWNLSGLGYSSSGYSGPFGLAMTMDGAIVADYIKTGNLVFGGSGNTNGKLEIRDAQGNLICRFDKTGAEVKGDIIAESFQGDLVFGGTGENADGKLDIKDTSGNTVCHFDKNGASVKGDIVAESFDANAGDGNSYEILTGATTISMLGTLSGVVGYNSANEVMTGVAHRYTRTAVNDYHYSSAAFTKDPKKDAYAFMRYIHDATPSAGTITDMAEVSGHYQDGSTYINSHLQAGYSSSLHADVFGNIESSGSNVGSYYLGVSKSAGTTTGALSVRAGDSYISGSVSSNGSTGLAISNTSTSKIYLNGGSGNITCVSLTQTSSKKYKKKIKTLTEEEARKILELRPVTYDFKDEDCGKNMRGFIAEEVDEVIPELVKHTNVYPDPQYDEDGNIIEQEDEVSLDYTMMIPYLTKMIQLQQKQIDDLKNEINKLKGEC